ncbi:MAG: hypothetical protein E7314_05900 [Clostridiales bacterium]|nr:hypothetical protein [Clostridiales bacterium]
MLFDILFKILVLSILIMLFLCVFELYKRVDMQEPTKQERKVPKKLFSRDKKQQNKADKRLNQILDNIDNYTGDELGQKEIKK